MMGELINANYIASLISSSRNDKWLSIVGSAGDNFFINGSPKQCNIHFDILCGLHCPDIGDIKLCGKKLYEMNTKEVAAFRRDMIGAVPQDLGLIPELRMIDQIVLPMKLAGIDNKSINLEICKLTSELIPLHNLYNLPGKCTIRKQTHAAIIRAVIRNPQIIIFNSCLDDLSDVDQDFLWHAFHTIRPQNSVFVYFSGTSAPEQVNWTQQFRI